MVFSKAYRGFIRPILEYGTPAFSRFSRKNIKKLRSKNFGLKGFSYRRKASDVLRLYEIFYDECGLKLKKLFFSLRPSTTRGGVIKAQLKEARLNYRRHFSTCRTISKLNKNQNSCTSK